LNVLEQEDKLSTKRRKGTVIPRQGSSDRLSRFLGILAYFLQSPRASLPVLTAAPQGDGVVVMRARTQNSGYTEAISPWLPLLKVG
jgi:hypothetical protein